VDQSFPRLPVSSSSLPVTRSVVEPPCSIERGLYKDQAKKRRRMDLCHHEKCGNGVNRMKMGNASSSILTIHTAQPSCRTRVNRSSSGSSVVVSSLYPRALIGPPFGDCAYPAFRLLQLGTLRDMKPSSWVEREDASASQFLRAGLEPICGNRC
jgi:hypothetical protein